METLFGKEEPEAERKRQDLRVVAVQSRAQLEENEQRVLTMLSSAAGNVLDDDELIDTLANSKIASQRVEERIAEQLMSEKDQEEKRALYRPLAQKCAVLFLLA